MTTLEGAVIVAPWRFDIGTNVIIGLVERNLSLMTQLIKRHDMSSQVSVGTNG
jgi:hypothetical protein